LNATAPGVVRNREFARVLGARVGKPARLPTPGFALRLGMGVMAETIISGRRVVPRAALDLGYQFHFPDLEGALLDLVPAAAGPTRAG
jgi:NAD dependent epimerase/dehydratase family enzyme